MIEAVDIRPGEARDAPACAAIMNDWIDETPWLPRRRVAEEIERHYIQTVFPNREVWVADTGAAAPGGYMTLSEDGFVMALFVAAPARGRGLGAALLDRAKVLRGALKLWTFEANTGARRFYTREGFAELERTRGENEEGLPDILYGWRAYA